MRKSFAGPSMAALAGLMLLLFSSCGAESADTSAKGVAAGDAAFERKPAPDFVLQDAEGRDVKLSEFQGKVVLLNFWATWCGPCKIEMPWFVEFQRKYKDKGFSVLAVSLDEEGWDVVRPFAEDLKLNFPVVVGDDALAEKFGGIAALPTTFILDKQGNITTKHTGLVSRSEYEEAIEKLL